MRVPMIDLKALHAPIRDRLASKLVEVLDSTAYINGPYVTEFEDRLAQYCGVKHAVGVTSGSDALIIALMNLGIGPGDEVITTPFTFFATAGAIDRVGARPVFVDIEPDGFNIDPGGIEAAVTERTRGIIAVSLFGQMPAMDEIVGIARDRGLWVIEDAAQSIGARFDGRASGSYPLAGTLSFFPAKNLGGIGDGGAVLTDDDGFADGLRSMRNHGGHDRYYHDRVGGNFRLDAIQAAVLTIKLDYLTEWEERRRQVAAFYRDQLKSIAGIGCPKELPKRHHVYNQFVIRVQDGRRAQVMRHLEDRGIAHAIYYPLCLHQQTCFADLGYKDGDFPQAERAADQVLAVPVLTDRPELVVEALKEAISG